MSLEPSPVGSRPRITIDIVSDVVCPWCYVGKRKLEQALARRPDVEVDLSWRPFQLDPTIPPAGVPRDAYLEKKFGSTGRLAEIHERISGAGAEVGIAFAFERIGLSPNTLDAHRLVRWAQASGRQTEVVEALFRAYFQEGRDIGDRSVLAELAGRNGLDADETARRLAAGEDVDAVRGEIASAMRLGVTGVPFFILDSKFAVPGAQSPDVLAAAIDKAVEEAPAAVLPA